VPVRLAHLAGADAREIERDDLQIVGLGGQGMDRGLPHPYTLKRIGR